MSKKLSKSSVKEAFDNLPSGIGCFNENGLLVLCNTVMQRLVLQMTGQVLQSESDIANALNGLPFDSAVKRNGEVYLFPDKTAWKFSVNTIQSGKIYKEYIASDITELYKRKKELAVSTAEYGAMIEVLKRITDNVLVITREEEILNMKMGVHGKVGWPLQRLNACIANGKTAENRVELATIMLQVAESLEREIGNTDEVDVLGELLDLGKKLGVTVEINGTLPQDKTAYSLLIMSLRECITNTVRHAEGNHVKVDITDTDSTTEISITNNGKPPKGKIEEGGGLGSLRRSVDKAGGTMRISHIPVFTLTISVSNGR